MDTIDISLPDFKSTLQVPAGCTLEEVYQLLPPATADAFPPIAALVNNKVEGMHYRIYHPQQVQFIDITHPSGLRIYTRTLFFVLCKAVHDLYDRCKVAIDIPVSNGYYVNLDIGHPVTDNDAEVIRQKMQEIIDAAIPVHRHETTTEEAIKMFNILHSYSKVKLLRGTGRLYTTFYDIDGYIDYYYGALLTNTSQLTLFGLEHYHDGLLLRTPSPQNPRTLGSMTPQPKMFSIFREHHRWQDLLGMRTIGDLNEAIEQGHAASLILVSEALQEKKISKIADEIAESGKKLVLIAGPSSSGKTTTCKRISVQLVTSGIKPVQLSLDDYFLDRDKTPKDANGQYDFEHIEALNLPLLHEQLGALLNGEEVELPRYDFPTGKSEMSGKRLKLAPDQVLVVEGIHALNPQLITSLSQQQVFRVYASALTTLLLDNHNYIPTTDNRLLRRIIRDHKYRAVSALDTIRRWPSVRRGENRWIFPFQEQADQMFNTAMLFELAVLKSQAEPLLQQVPETEPEYAEAYRLRKFLGYIKPISDDIIPPTSLLREFLGGSTFIY